MTEREVPQVQHSRRQGGAQAQARSARGGGALLVAAVLLMVTGALVYRGGPEWLAAWLRGKPPGIVIHHSATPAVVRGQPVTAAVLDQAHAGRGWGRRDSSGRVYHIGYHYVVLADGTVQAGRPEGMRGAHCDGHNDMLGICLVGDFTAERPPAAQLRAAEDLTRRLMAKYHLSPSQVHRHCDLDSTECPGKKFPWQRFREALMSDR